MAKPTDYLEQLALAGQRGHSRAAPQPSRSKAPAKSPAIELDPQHRARSVDAIADRLGRIEGATDSDRAVAQTRRATRKAERETGDGKEVGGTGQTILKRSDAPITRLLNSHRIGHEEMLAAEDIHLAATALTSALWLRPLNMERADRSASPTEPARTVDAVARYRRWSEVWARRAKRGDPTADIVWSAIVDERSFRDIDAELELKHGRAAKALTAGLRDYAARAGWATGSAGQRWLVGEGSVFKLRPVRPAETLRSMARRWDRGVAA